MAGAVPLNDLPDSLRGTVVPMDDLPGGTPLEGELLPPTGAQRMYQNTMDAARRQSDASTAVFDLVGNAIVNAPADIANSAARLLASGAGRTANFLGIKNNWEADARDPARSFARVPLLTRPGQEAAEGIGEAMPDWLSKVDPAIWDLANVAGAATPFRPKGPTGVPADLIRKAGGVAPQARAAGFEVTPSAVAGSRSVEPSGAAATLENRLQNPKASLRNAQQLNRRLGDELAIQVDADGRFNPQAFDEARKPAFAVYEEAKGMPGGPSAEYSDAVVKAIRGIDVPTEGAAELARLTQKYSQVGDSAQLVEDLKNLRRTASKRREGDAANQVANEALADVQMAIADALEDELGRRATTMGDAGFQSRLRGARMHLAQLHEAERATVGGYVDAAQLAARQQKTGKLTGNLQLGASMGENLPDVFQHPQTAAPASTGRLPEAASSGGLLFRTGERLGGGLLSRMAMGRFNRDIPFGPNALDEFNISPVRDRTFDSPMGPNAGPQPPPPPRPAPRFAAGDGNENYGPLGLSFEDQVDPRFSRFAQGGQVPAANADLVDWEFPLEIGTALPRLDPDVRMPAVGVTDMATGAAEPGLPISALLGGDIVSRRAKNLGAGIQGDFAAQLGTPAAEPGIVDFDMGRMSPGMPDRPRGVAGPRSAQLSSPQLPPGLSLESPDFNSLLAPPQFATDAELLQTLGLEPGEFASFSRELDQAPFLSEGQPMAAGMPDRPRGVSGPRSAQLSDPRLPRGLQIIDDGGQLPPLGPEFGPGDEFPGAAPIMPRGPAPNAPAGAADDFAGLMGEDPMFETIGNKLAAQEFADALLDPNPAAGALPEDPMFRQLGDRLTARPQGYSDLVGGPRILHRGVPEGVDPMAPNAQGFTTWSGDRGTAGRYGPQIGEMPFDPQTFPHRGTLEELRAAVGAGPDATAQDIAQLVLMRDPSLRGFSYDLPPELDGVPREYILRGQ